jgi:pimeloyl-ACP methyl ester carboxylesterase
MRRVFLCIFLGALWISGLLSNAIAADANGVEHWVEANGVKIRIWEKFVGDATGKPVIVLAHGSATSGQESFDLQMPGKPSYSLMEFLAQEQYDVFALDVRGFGRSTHPDTGVTTAEAAEDLNAVVDYVTKLRSTPKIGLLAWSWGTQYGGMFIMAHPEKVSRYISFAQMHVNSPDVARRRPRVEALRKAPYISIPEAGWKTRFMSMAPEAITEPEVKDAFAKAASAVEKNTPTGPQIDMATILPMVNPKLIPVPTMIIHGQHDDVADPEGLLPFFLQLPNPHKKYVIIPDAGHMMQLQRGHRIFQQEVALFFKPAP